MSEEMKALREQLLRNDKNGYDTLDEAQLAEMEAYCADYKAFLNEGKTERLSARAAIAAAEAKGFVQYKRGMALKAGDKVYTCRRSSVRRAWPRARRSRRRISTRRGWI